MTGKMRRLLAVAMMGLLLAAGLVACGGGGGNGSAAQATPQAVFNGVSGRVQGHVAGAAVTISILTGTGARHQLASAVTDAQGAYSTSVWPEAGDVVLVEVQGGQYTDAYTGARQALTVPLRAVVVWQGNSDQIAVSAFTELVVRSLEREQSALAVVAGSGRKVAAAASATSGIWGSDHVTEITGYVTEELGVPELSNFSLVDLGQPLPANLGYASYAMGMMVGGFDVFTARVASGRVAEGLDKLYALLAIDYADDVLRPPFFAAIATYADHTQESAENKFSIKSWALLRNQGGNEQDLIKAVPTGVATGGGTAVMPNAGLVMLGAASMVNTSYGPLYFNHRGALVAYPYLASPLSYRFLHTASVAEVVADGEVAIGRWNGGVVGEDRRDSTGQVTSSTYAVLYPSEGIYALGLPATAVPVCGQRSLTLLGQTRDKLGHSPQLSGLQAVSARSAYAMAQVEGKTRVGLNVLLETTTGETLQFRSNGAELAAWRSNVVAADNGQFDVSLSPVLASANFPGASLRVKGLVAGVGAGKLVLRMELYSENHQSTEWAAALAAQQPLDTSICTPSPNQPGQASISALPVNGGGYLVAGKAFGDVPTSGTLHNVIFGPRGQLSQFDDLAFVVPTDTPTYDLYGSDQLLIGRVNGAVRDFNLPYTRALTYLVGRPTTALPFTGSGSYTFTHATEAYFRPWGSSTPLEVRGQITQAGLKVDLGSPYYGAVTLSLSGTLAGQPFTFTMPLDSTRQPTTGLLYRDQGVFQYSDGYASNRFYGMIAGDRGQLAGLYYVISVEGGTLEGSVLLSH